MNSELEQIRISYETEGMSLEEIAQDRDLDIVATKAALMQCSPKYRKDCGKEAPDESTLNFSSEQQLQARDVIHEIMVASEDDHLRFKAAVYLRDDAKGRKDVVRDTKNLTFNLFDFNSKMRELRERKAINV